MPKNVNHKRNVLWLLASHYSQIGITIIQGIVLVPLYLAYVDPHIYGAWLATGNLLVLLGLIDPGLFALLQQRIAHSIGKNRQEDVHLDISVSFLLTGILATLATTLGFLFTQEAGSWVGLESPEQIATLSSALKIAILSTGGMFVAFLLGSIAYGFQLTKAPGIVSTTAGVLGILTTLLLIRSHGLDAIALGMLTRTIFYIIGNGYLTFISLADINYKWQFNRNRSVEILKLCHSGFFANALRSASQNMEALTIANIIGPSAATSFIMTQRPQRILTSLIQRIAASFKPGLSHKWGQGSHFKVLQVTERLTRIVIWGSFLSFALLINTNCSFISLWIGAEFFSGYGTNAVLATSLISAAISYTIAEISFALGAIRNHNKIIAVQSALTILAYYVLARTSGTLGVAIAPLITSTLIALPTFLILLFKQQLSSTKTLIALTQEIAKTAVAAIIIIILHHLLWTPRTWHTWIIVNALGCAAFLCTLFATSKDFRTEALQLVNRGIAIIRGKSET